MGRGEKVGRAARVAAPAKLNLGLRVVGRRADGYHELESLFLPIDLADELELELRLGAGRRVHLRLEGDLAQVPTDATNLAACAAEEFLEAAGLAAEVSIVLRKRVPAAAGLGGGSSDGAAVLRALAQLLPGAMPPSRLAEVALRLGADVPFFLQNPPRAAWVTGIGERVDPLEKFPDVGILLAHPGQSLVTRAVFEGYDALAGALTPPGRRPTMRSLSGLRDLVVQVGSGLLANDLEPAATRLCPPIARLRDKLRACDALGVGMSGSGPTLFALFADPAAAGQALRRLALEAPAWARVASRFEPSIP